MSRAGPPPSAPAPPEAAPLPAGTRVDRYVVLERAGAGRTGVVYKAYDLTLDRKAALKVLRGGEDEGLRTRLLWQAQTLAELSHPNLAPAYDVVVAQGHLAAATEFVEGETLRAWSAEPRSWRKVLQAFVAAGRGLAAAHAAGVVHGAFKADDVLVGKDGRARVVDFGLAPAGGAAADAKGDQLAFCAALYEALYREPPPPEGPEAAGEGPGRRRLPLAGDETSAQVWRALARGLRADPGQRYPSMGALLADLTRDPAAAQRRVVAAAFLASVAIVAATLAWQRSRRPPPCGGAEGEIARAWGPAQRQAVRDAFLATGAPYAEAALRELTRALDEYAVGWAGLRAEACEATLVRGEQPPDLLDLRNACLDERRRALEAFGAELAQADADAVRVAPLGARDLPDLARCSDAAALRALPPPPDDAVARQRVERARDEMARADASRLAGRPARARAQLETAVAEAEASGYPPVAAEAHLRWATLDDRPADPRPVAGALLRALWHAEAGRHGDALVRAWARLAHVQSRQAQPAEAKASARHAESLLTGLGRPAPLEAWVARELGAAHAQAGEPAVAERHWLRALEIERGRFGRDDLRLAALHADLAGAYRGLGRFDQALAEERRSIEILEGGLGPGHPRACQALDELRAHLQDAWRIDEAREAGERALGACEAAHGAEGRAAALAALHLGHLAALVGQSERAVPLARRALDGLSRHAGPESADAVRATIGLSAALASHGEGEAAIASAERAIVIEAKLPSRDEGLRLEAYRALAEAELAAGRPRAALHAAERAVEFAKAAPGKAHARAGAARLLLGIIELASDWVGAAATTLSVAANELEAAGAEADPLDVAATQFALGRAQGGARGAELTEQARAGFARQGNAGRQRLARLEALVGKHGAPGAR
ncbi:MAG TPA: tetratricopeptide repeat-containing protein kinase family protein [Polyangiaceae bacterium]|nr:tetratricopeptide repeat-containing protein kinase family protein [Polyangiaceae bacterium]